MHLIHRIGNSVWEILAENKSVTIFVCSKALCEIKTISLRSISTKIMLAFCCFACMECNTLSALFKLIFPEIHYHMPQLSKYFIQLELPRISWLSNFNWTPRYFNEFCLSVLVKLLWILVIIKYWYSPRTLCSEWVCLWPIFELKARLWIDA